MLPSAKSRFLGGCPTGGTKTLRAFAPANEAERRRAAERMNSPEARDRTSKGEVGRRLPYGVHRRAATEQDDNACRYASDTSRCHNGEDRPAKTATHLDPLRLWTPIPV